MSTPLITIRGIRQEIPPGYVLGRTQPGVGQPHLISIQDLGTAVKATPFFKQGLSPGASVILDSIGGVQGDILYRDVSAWKTLAPGTAGQVLQTGGASANPSWGTASGGSGAMFAPNLKFSTTDTWAANDVILRPLMVASGRTMQGAGVMGNAASGGAKWSIGLFDNSGFGPHTLLASSAQQTGIVQGVNYVNFTTPYTLGADMLVWMGVWSDTAFSIYAETAVIAFWSNPGGTWPSTAPAFSTNSNGSALFAKIL